MFYSIRQVMDTDWTPTGKFWVALVVDPDACSMNDANRQFDSVEEAKAEYGMVNWQAPSAEASEEVMAEGWDE